MHTLGPLAHFPLQTTTAAWGQISFRSSGQARHVSHVLLHGIGSASGSWAGQLGAAEHQTSHRLLAWDAPGYGNSTTLLPPEPQASDYARRLWQWLDSLAVANPVVLVGHSLGALMAASACRLAPERVAGLVLLAPAQGYGQAPVAERHQKLQDRLQMLARLGPEGMAAQRGATMLSGKAPPHLLKMIQTTMAAIRPEGYVQASHMLANGQLVVDLAACPAHLPITVASGAADTITPPSACQTVATAVGQAWRDLGPVGHACPLEAVHLVNALLGLPEHTL